MVLTSRKPEAKRFKRWVIGEVLRKRFLALRERSRLVGDARGPGAMIGIALSTNRDPNLPAVDAGRAVATACRENGVLTLTAGRHGNVVRVLCPLVISDDDLKRGLDVVEDAIISLSSKESV